MEKMNAGLCSQDGVKISFVHLRVKVLQDERKLESKTIGVPNKLKL